MKKFLFFFGIISLMFFSACNNDDDNVGGFIVGTWYMNAVTVKGTVKNGTNSAPIDQTQPADACSQRTQFVFNADGTGSVVTYQNSNGSCINTASETFTYKHDASSGTLAITSGGQTEVMKLNTLTSTEFSFGENFNNVDFGKYDPSLSGYYFTGTISTIFKKK